MIDIGDGGQDVLKALEFQESEEVEAVTDDPPTRRVKEKSKPRVAHLEVSEEELNLRLQRGVELANEEFKKLDEENRTLEARIKALRKEEDQKKEEECQQVANEDAFLQTKTFSLQEVRRDPGPWIDSMKAELNCLLENQAIRIVSKKEADELCEAAKAENKKVETIPAKCVFTRKSGSGRYKTRVVACGNLMEERCATELYASGLDAVPLRVLLRAAGGESWRIGSLDIRTAFLLAPTSQQELIVITPPRVLFDCGLLEEGTQWIVTGALYGLTTAPRDWGKFRDGRVAKMSWKEVIKGVTWNLSFEQLKDPNVWKIQGMSSDGVQQTMGYMAVYVDDILFVAPDEVLRSAADEIQRHWTTSPLEVVDVGSTMKFCGVEVEGLSGGDYKIHQTSYTKELIQRHGVTSRANFIKNWEDPNVEPDPDTRDIRRAQMIAGELLWLSGRTRPDIAVAVSRMSRWITRAPKWTIALGDEVLAYLNATLDVGLIYGKVKEYDDDPEIKRDSPRHRGTIEVLTDASFAPSGDHSISGLVILMGGAPVQWHTQRQGLVALSTAEAELVAMVDALQSGRALRSFVELIFPVTEMEMHGDNRAALVLATGQGGGWRTRHLRIRSSALSDALNQKELALHHRSGTKLLADALTKLLPTVPLAVFRKGMGMSDVEQKPSLRKCQGGSMMIDVRDKVVELLMKPIGLLVAAVSSLPSVRGMSIRGVDMDAEIPPDTTDWTWLLLLLSVLLLWEMFKSFSVEMIQSVLGYGNDMKVSLISPDATVPIKATSGAAGFDISCIEDFALGPGERKLVSSGLKIQLPKETYGRLASKSGLATRHGIEVGAGVIDSDFRGEIKVLMFNRGTGSVEFKKGDQVAQLVVERIADVKVKVGECLTETVRGEGGFGSTSTNLVRETVAPRAASLSLFKPDLPDAYDPNFQRCAGHWRGNHSQSMSDLLDTFGEDFKRTVFPEGMPPFLTVNPENNRNGSAQYELRSGGFVKLFTHAAWRKKLFDTNIEPDTWSFLSTTLLWLHDGRVQVIVKERKGIHESMMDQLWKGYTIMYRRA